MREKFFNVDALSQEFHPDNEVVVARLLACGYALTSNLGTRDTSRSRPPNQLAVKRDEGRAARSAAQMESVCKLYALVHQAKRSHHPVFVFHGYSTQAQHLPERL